MDTNFNNGFLLQFGWCHTSVSSGDNTIILPLSYTFTYAVTVQVEDWDDYTICSVSAGFPNPSSILVRIAVSGIVFPKDFHWITVGF